MKKLILIMSVGLSVVACSPEVKSVEYYSTNNEERQDVLRKCETTQGSSQDQNCLNAKQAQTKSTMNSMFGY